MLEIPSGCCGLAHTPSFPSLYPSPIPSHIFTSTSGLRRAVQHEADVSSLSPSPLSAFFFFKHLLPPTSPSPSLLFPSFLPSFFISWPHPGKGVRQSHMTATVEGLETGFYIWSNSVTHKRLSLSVDCGHAFSATAGRIRKRKDKWAGCACQREMGMMVCKQEGVSEPCTMPKRNY